MVCIGERSALEHLDSHGHEVLPTGPRATDDRPTLRDVSHLGSFNSDRLRALDQREILHDSHGLDTRHRSNPIHESHVELGVRGAVYQVISRRRDHECEDVLDVVAVFRGP